MFKTWYLYFPDTPRVVCCKFRAFKRLTAAGETCITAGL